MATTYPDMTTKQIEKAVNDYTHEKGIVEVSVIVVVIFVLLPLFIHALSFVCTLNFIAIKRITSKGAIAILPDASKGVPLALGFDPSYFHFEEEASPQPFGRNKRKAEDSPPAFAKQSGE